MKQFIRIAALLLSVVFCVAELSIVASAAESVPVRGDCNDDDTVNMKDVLYLRQYLVGTVTAFPPHDCFGVDRASVRGDANADGAVNMKDVLTLRKLVAGLISGLRFCSCQEELAPHTVSVAGGSANMDEALPGETVFLTADLPEKGMEFDRWVCDSGNIVFDDAQSELVTFVMPNEDVTVRATYKNIVYTVFVTDGVASNAHPHPGDTVTVTANTPHPGEVFDCWFAEGVEIKDVSSTVITFVMPENNVSLMATYMER